MSLYYTRACTAIFLQFFFFNQIKHKTFYRRPTIRQWRWLVRARAVSIIIMTNALTTRAGLDRSFHTGRRRTEANRNRKKISSRNNAQLLFTTLNIVSRPPDTARFCRVTNHSELAPLIHSWKRSRIDTRIFACVRARVMCVCVYKINTFIRVYTRAYKNIGGVRFR